MAVDVRRCGGATLVCVSVRCSGTSRVLTVFCTSVRGGRTGTYSSARERYVYTAIEPALLLKCVVNTDRRLRDRWEIVSP